MENDGNEDRCGTLDSTDSRFVGDYDTNATQYGALVRALAHVYVPTVVPPEQRLKGQVMDVNDCLALPAEQALANPSSYSFYVTSKIFLISRFLSLSFWICVGLMIGRFESGVYGFSACVREMGFCGGYAGGF